MENDSGDPNSSGSHGTAPLFACAAPTTSNQPKSPIQMKATSYLAALLGVTLGASAWATPPVLHISGAATYRPPIQKAIEDSLKSGYVFGYYGSSRYKPSAAIYSGTLASNNQAVIIETFWTGDVSGVTDVALQHSISGWIPTDSTTLASLTTSGNKFSSYTAVSAIPDATVSVSFYTSSAAVVATAGGNGAAAATKIVNTAFVDAGSASYAGGNATLGLAAFIWEIGNTSTSYTSSTPYSAITNITQQAADTLISSGYLPAAFLTGTNSDLNNYLVLVGRSEDAGARTVPFAEAQNGFGNPPQQFALTFSNNQTTQADGRQTGGATASGTASVTGAALWPANAPLYTESTINWNQAGHSGYILTSDLSNAASALNPVAISSITGLASSLPANAAQAYLVSYNGVADATSVVNAKLLNYNGVPYSVANVQNGSYSLWSYAHLYYIGSGTGALTAGSVIKQAADDVADTVFRFDADTNSSGAHGTSTGTGIFFNSSVVVSRQLEGGLQSQTY